jgi:hypothetical protein
MNSAPLNQRLRELHDLDMDPWRGNEGEITGVGVKLTRFIRGCV